jgi:hypothetical protein
MKCQLISVGSDIAYIDVCAVFSGEDYPHAACVVGYVVDLAALDCIEMVALLLDLDAYEVACGEPVGSRELAGEERGIFEVSIKLVDPELNAGVGYELAHVGRA